MYACLPSPATCRGTRASADRRSTAPRGPLLWCTRRCSAPLFRAPDYSQGVSTPTQPALPHLCAPVCTGVRQHRRSRARVNGLSDARVGRHPPRRVHFRVAIPVDRWPSTETTVSICSFYSALHSGVFGPKTRTWLF